MNLLVDGSLPIEVPLTAVRMVVGTFFAISGYNKLVDPNRHASLTLNLTHNHIPAVGFMQWWVPAWELIGGAMLTIGLLTPFAAFVLSVICLVACCCEAKKRVDAYKPINGADRLDDYLYLQEILYLCMLSLSIFGGGGTYSVDNWLF